VAWPDRHVAHRIRADRQSTGRLSSSARTHCRALLCRSTWYSGPSTGQRRFASRLRLLRPAGGSYGGALDSSRSTSHDRARQRGRCASAEHPLYAAWRLSFRAPTRPSSLFPVSSLLLLAVPVDAPVEGARGRLSNAFRKFSCSTSLCEAGPIAPAEGRVTSRISRSACCRSRWLLRLLKHRARLAMSRCPRSRSPLVQPLRSQ